MRQKSDDRRQTTDDGNSERGGIIFNRRLKQNAGNQFEKQQCQQTTVYETGRKDKNTIRKIPLEKVD
jgi:hypothetical protein